ncbi:thioesterase II family protein [Herpetosiphon giganteus]|uniref:thioesterase II family protein n=1 Tax=Herpetosiphon giganteus TaxID=2029754 RepID=UPI00195EEC8D|nr:alpha/beta fold hydrolase [Herpetosiphon giganteus]MBM7845956.1 surfactin synthase thioesterase subunit [Herpetosiphon giganteus]
MTNPWFPYRAARQNPQLKLFCFAFAGGAASLFRTWPLKLPDWVEVVAVQLPGRESRLREPLYTDLMSLVNDLGQVLAPELNQPFAFFGHSLGAMISFELARELRRLQVAQPSWLWLSARRAPQLLDTSPRIAHLSKQAFTEHMIQHYQGIPPEVAREPELMNLFVPIMHADIQMVETYAYADQPALDCPLTVIGGIDDPTMTMAHLSPWRQQTSKRFNLRQVPGDHFFVRNQPDLLLQIINEELNLLTTFNQLE